MYTVQFNVLSFHVHKVKIYVLVSRVLFSIRTYPLEGFWPWASILIFLECHGKLRKSVL